jgi:hypothetical protein
VPLRTPESALSRVSKGHFAEVDLRLSALQLSIYSFPKGSDPFGSCDFRDFKENQGRNCRTAEVKRNEEILAGITKVFLFILNQQIVEKIK